MVYQNIKVDLTKSQIEKIAHAIKHDTGFTLRISVNHDGKHHLPVTKTQHKKLESGKDHDIEMSKAQVKHIKSMHHDLKHGGLLPLAALIPLIASALGGIGGITSGIASAVNSSRE